MKITIRLDDTVAETYQSRLRPNQTLGQVLAIQLTRFASLDPRERFLVVSPVDQQELADLTTHLPLVSAADLIRRVGALAELSIGQIRFRWTPAQWRELLSRADRWRMSPREYAERIVRQIEEQFFSEQPKAGEILLEVAPPAAPGLPAAGPPKGPEV